MIPILFKIPILGFPIYSFGLMMATAFLLSSYILRKLFKASNFKEEVAEKIVFTAAIAGLLGAKLYYLFFEAFDQLLRHPIDMLFSGAGLTWYGGFILAAISIVYLLRKNNIPVWKGVDIVSIPLALGYGIGRIGCHLSGDGDYGLPWDGPWATNYSKGVVPPSHAFADTEIAKNYPGGVVPDNTLCHPTPMYEALLSVLIFVALWQLWKRKPKDGTIFYLYLILGGLERFAIEFMRLNPRLALGLSGAQWISILFISVGAFGLFRLYRVAEKD